MKTKFYLSKFTEKRFVTAIGVILAAFIAPSIASESTIAQAVESISKAVVALGVAFGYMASEAKVDTAKLESSGDKE